MLAKIKIFTRSDFFKGSAILTISAFLTNIFNYFFNFIVGRTLGPAGFGEIAAIFSYTYIFSVPMAVATSIIIQKIGSATNKMERVVALEHLFWEKFSRFWYIFILMIPAPFLFSYLTNLSITSSIFFFLMIFVGFIGTFYSSVLQGLKLFFIAGVLSLIAASVKFSGALITLIPGLNNINVVLFLILVSSISGLLLSLVLLRKKSKAIEIKKIEKRFLSILLDRQTILTTLSLLAIALMNNADIIFVKKFFSASDAGLYSAWSLFGRIIFYVLGPLITVAYIFFTERNDNKKNRLQIFLWLIFFMIIGLSSYIMYSIFSHEIISLLFGTSYFKISQYLGLAGIFGTLYTVIVFFNNYFLAKKSKYAYIIALVMPFYLYGLFLCKKDIVSVININIMYSGFISLCYLLAFLKKDPE